MPDACDLLVLELKIVSNHCRETGLKAGAGAVENAIAEIARLRQELALVSDGEAQARYLHLQKERDGLVAQIDSLAQWILKNVPGEPSRSQGAVETAIRLLARVKAQEAVANAIATFHQVYHGEYDGTLILRQIPFSFCRDPRCQALAHLDKVGKGEA